MKVLGDVPPQPQTMLDSTPSVNEGQPSPIEVFINLVMTQFKLIAKIIVFINKICNKFYRRLLVPKIALAILKTFSV